jgi:hypothetical protein
VLYLALNLALLAGLALGLRHLSLGQPLFCFFWPGLLAKWAAGIGIGLLYKFYYQSGDTIFLFEQGGHLANLLRQSPSAFWQFPNETPYKDLYYFGVFKDLNPRVLFFGKLTAIFHLLTGGNYWLAGAYYSLFSFVGLWLCANQLARIFRPWSPLGLAIAFFFFPSTVVWSAGLLKESLLWGFLGNATALGLYYLWPDRHPTDARVPSPVPWVRWAGHALGLAGCLYGLLQLKYYYLAAWLPSLAALAGARLIQARSANNWLVATIFALTFGGLLMAATQLHPTLRLDNLAQALARNYDAMADATDIDNLIYYPLAPTAASLGQNVPKALWSGLFAPLPWEWHGNPMKLWVGLENLLLLVLLAYQCLRLCLGPRNRWLAFERSNWPLLWAGLLYVGLLAIMLALASANLGALIRYKNGFMPFFVALLWPQPWFRRD